MSAIRHITFKGQRLDQIAYEYYGDVGQITRLLDANPLLPIQRNYPAGTVIIIPIIEKTSQSDNLPPWLR